MRCEHSMCSKHKLPVPVAGNPSPGKGAHPAPGAAQPRCSQTLSLPPASQNSGWMETQKIYIGKSPLIAIGDKNLYLTFKLCDLLQPLYKPQLLGAWVGV